MHAAVEAGQFDSARRHYELFGRAEHRALEITESLSRRDRLIGGLDLARMVGVEIGPLAAPIVGKNEGTVFYIDHADTDTLDDMNRDCKQDECDDDKRDRQEFRKWAPDAFHDAARQAVATESHEPCLSMTEPFMAPSGRR